MVPAKKRFLLFLATAITLVILAGCGGGGSINFPPPQGTFTNANLSGPFAFSYTGSDAGGFLSVAGSFVADGAGHITSGTQDINSTLLNSPINAAITGTYLVRADGRGSITLNSPTPNSNSSLDFVIVAGGHALVTRFDMSATGSGTIDQQTTSAFSNPALAGPFAFSLSGIDTAGLPLAVGGVFTSDATGTLTSGLDDSNDNGLVVTNDPMTGSIPMTSSGRGTATLNTSHGALTFAYYVVDANHLKIVGTNSVPALGGEAFRQTGPFTDASVSGPFAFTMAGADLLSLNPFVAGGVLTSDGAGNVTSGIEDFNDGGNGPISNVPLTGTYSVAANGRGTLTLNTGVGTFSFAIYPSSGGVLMLELDNTFQTSGTALQQQTAPFTAGSFQGTYGMSFDAASGGSELDSISEFTADGVSKLNGIIDINNNGGITFGQSITGTFAAASNGRFAFSLQTPLGVQNTVVYLVNGNRALFIEVDGGLVAAGDIRHQ